ncbi:MAG TPA: hypothetical protein VMU92_06855 [Acidobacteriaceae bacterium]|nr:hypothetical protein [Acidobacteriaceae bacterium]
MKMFALRLSVSSKAVLAVAMLPLLALPALAATGSSADHQQLVSANAQLTTSLNTKKLSQGARITARLTSNVKAAGSVDIPKGSVLIGKVEHVSMSRDKGPSKLSIVFNQARLHNGHTVPVKATLLAAYPSASWGSDGNAGGSYTWEQSHIIPNDQKVDQEPGTLSHIAMQSAVQSPVSGVFTSKNRNIKLHRGTRFQLAIAPMAKKG